MRDGALHEELGDEALHQTKVYTDFGFFTLYSLEEMMRRFAWWRKLLRLRGRRTFVLNGHLGKGLLVMTPTTKEKGDRFAEIVKEGGWMEEA